LGFANKIKTQSRRNKLPHVDLHLWEPAMEGRIYSKRPDLVKNSYIPNPILMSSLYNFDLKPLVGDITRDHLTESWARGE
jgi:hypothetical protein